MIKLGFGESFSLLCFEIGEFPFYDFNCRFLMVDDYQLFKIVVLVPDCSAVPSLGKNIRIFFDTFL